MTPIHKIRADFKELRAVEITCIACGAEISLPLSGYVGQNAVCVSCNRQLWGNENDKTYQRVRGLVNMLHEWAEQKDASFRLGFSLNLDAGGR